MPAPASVEERGLVDDVGAGRHGVLGGRLGRAQGRGVAFGVRDLDDRTALVAQALQVALLVLDPFGEQHFEHLVGALGGLAASSPRATARSRWVRWRQARYFVRSVGLTNSTSSDSYIAPPCPVAADCARGLGVGMLKKNFF